MLEYLKTTRTVKKGMGPGTLVHIGRRREHSVGIQLIQYNSTEYKELKLSGPEDVLGTKDPPDICWYNVDGIHDADVVAKVGGKFGIHTLVLEDIMNSTNRPKVEIFDDYIFVTLKILEHKENFKNLHVEQLSLVIGQNFLLSFQEDSRDNFDSIRERIRTSKGKVRTKDANYLTYLILDTVVDNYIVVSERFAEQIEILEKIVLTEPTEQTQQKILSIRKELLDLKRSIDPLKEAINTITREMDSDTAKYYRDLHDHIIYEAENIGMYREMLSNLLDLYHSNLGMKMNEIIKILTIITTIFVPLTFIVGVYGMNFDNMPELKNQNGYYMVMGFMLAIVVVMLIYFKRKKWF